MSKNYDIYDEDLMEQMLDEEAVGRIARKRQKPHNGGQKDSKRLRDTYIGTNKKGSASRAARLAKQEERNEKQHDRAESELADLQAEICGKGKKRINAKCRH